MMIYYILKQNKEVESMNNEVLELFNRFRENNKNDGVKGLSFKKSNDAQELEINFYNGMLKLEKGLGSANGSIFFRDYTSEDLHGVISSNFSNDLKIFNMIYSLIEQLVKDQIEYFAPQNCVNLKVTQKECVSNIPSSFKRFIENNKKEGVKGL